MSKFMCCSNIFSQKTLKIMMVAIAQLLLISSKLYSRTASKNLIHE